MRSTSKGLLFSALLSSFPQAIGNSTVQPIGTHLTEQQQTNDKIKTEVQRILIETCSRTVVGEDNGVIEYNPNSNTIEYCDYLTDSNIKWPLGKEVVHIINCQRSDYGRVICDIESQSLPAVCMTYDMYTNGFGIENKSCYDFERGLDTDMLEDLKAK